MNHNFEDTNEIKFRHFVACCDCKVIWMIRDNTYNTCRKCGGHNLSLYTYKGTIDELEMIDGAKWDYENEIEIV